MEIKKPKMILFDYGETLIYESEINTLRGEEALFKYIKSNKNNLTLEEINEFSQNLFKDIGAVRKIDFELHERQFQKFLYDYLEIELSISLLEAEKIFWDNTSIGAIMPNADKIIDYINSQNIRSGVISNIGYSGAALTERINRFLPHNKFEFIMASSEYMLRKPNPMLFKLALKKAGLNAGDVWFCGDNIKADIEGSAAVGLLPVWYEGELKESTLHNENKSDVPNCTHLHIHNWTELIDLLENM